MSEFNAFNTNADNADGADRYIYLYPTLKEATIDLYVPTFSKGYRSALQSSMGGGNSEATIGAVPAASSSLLDSSTAAASLRTAEAEAVRAFGESFAANAHFFTATTEEQRFIQTIAEPISRPNRVHKYRITPFSLGAAVSAGLSWRDVCAFLARRCVNWSDLDTAKEGGEDTQSTTPLNQNPKKKKVCEKGTSATDAISLSSSDDDEVANDADKPNGTAAKSRAAVPPPSQPRHPIASFIQRCMERYGKVTISFASDGQCYVESCDKALLLSLVRDSVVGSQCRIDRSSGCIKVTVHAPSSGIPPAEANAATPNGGVNADGANSEIGAANAPNPLPQNPATVPTPPSASSVRYYRAQLLDAVACKVVSERCLKLGYPCFHDYDYRNDDGVRRITCDLKAGTAPRPYQIAAVEASTASGRCRSGVLVLPCGAGKTLVGVMLVAAVKRRALIVCAGSVSVSQWKNQVLDFANLSSQAVLMNSSRNDESNNSSSSTNKEATSTAATAVSSSTSGGDKGLDGSSYKAVRTGPQRISVITSKEKTPITEDTDIVITTYSMLSVAKRQLDRLAAHVRAHRYAQRRQKRGGGGEGGAGNDGDADADDDSVSLADILAHHTTLSPAAKAKLGMFEPFGLVILDEVHVVPAEFFKDALSSLKTKATIGLTATFVREDHRIEALYHLVGAKLYDVGWQELAKDGFLARVMCVEVNCSMQPEFGIEYRMKEAMLRRKRAGTATSNSSAANNRKNSNTSSVVAKTEERGDGSSDSHDTTPLLVMLAAANPNKMKAVLQLAAAHRNDKVLLFCDHILLLKVYAKLLNCPIVSGETSHKERMMIFSDFQAVGGGSNANARRAAGVGGSGGGGGGACGIIAISRVGDVSVNLPSANVVVQVSSHGGSRRQEAQRLGRVLRPKDTVSFKGARQKALQAAFGEGSMSNSNSNSGGGNGNLNGLPSSSSSSSSSPSSTDWLKGVLDRGDAANANAYFYSLVTEYSVEVPYATRRSEFLVDQGYPFYAVMATHGAEPPPTSFRAKIEGTSDADASSASPTWGGGESNNNNTNRRGNFASLSSSSTLAMAPSSVPSVSIASLWSRAWHIGFLSRIVSGWELKYYRRGGGATLLTAPTRMEGADGSCAAYRSRPLTAAKREREEEEEHGGDVARPLDAFERSHAAVAVGVMMNSVVGPSFSTLQIAKPEHEANDDDDDQADPLRAPPTATGDVVSMTSISGLVLADDIVYSEM